MKARIYGLILLALFYAQTIAAQVTHQNVFDTIPFIMEHHNNRLKAFAQEPMKTGQIIFLGNSITEGGNWMQLFPNQDVINRGIGGDVAHGILQRMDEIIQRQPSKLFLLIGINDIGKDIPEAVIADNIGKIVDRLKKESPNTAIIVQSILPVNPEYPNFPQHYDKQFRVLMTNQLIYKVCKDKEVRFVNLFPYFLDDRQRLKSELTGDGLHLNAKGYELWVEILKVEGLM
ncbi:MAG: GDSL family lipase [Cytophagia bacterium]|nr:GDSL family lipase [Cytophagia bacterium]